MIKMKQIFLLVVTAVFIFSVNAGAEEELVWPIDPKLRCRDWEGADNTVWRNMGDVSIWNTKDVLKINIIPNDGLKIRCVNIHVVEDPADIVEVIDWKGQPKADNFDYQKDYLLEDGIPADQHQELGKQSGNQREHEIAVRDGGLPG